MFLRSSSFEFKLDRTKWRRIEAGLHRGVGLRDLGLYATDVVVDVHAVGHHPVLHGPVPTLSGRCGSATSVLAVQSADVTKSECDQTPLRNQRRAAVACATNDPRKRRNLPKVTARPYSRRPGGPSGPHPNRRDGASERSERSARRVPIFT